MQKDELIRRLMKTFVVELGDYVNTLNRDLLALERGPNAAGRAEIFKSLFRTGHSLKGTSRSMGVEVLATAGHHMESLFGAARDGRVALDRETFELLFAAADALTDAAQRLEAEQDMSASQIARLLPRLEAAAAGRNAPPATPTAPAPALSAPAPKAAAPTAEPPPAPAAAPETVSATEDAVVRISAARLERLIALGGELRVVHERTGGRRADIDRMLSMTERWQGELRTAEAALRGLPRDADPAAREAMKRLITQSRENLRWITRQLEHLDGALAADRKAMEQVATPLDQEMLRGRMIPFAQAAGGLDRSVRDVARAVGKEVDLVVVPNRVEIDRLVVAALKDPIQHLIRNAIDHGLETADERRAAGKSLRGRITLSGAVRNGMVEITIADDGRGFDLDAIRAKATALGLPVPDNDADVARLTFHHGFSTARGLTEISGRGVGLDVVKTAVEAMRGACDIATRKGRGTRFILTVPLTLTRLHALLVRTGGRTYAFDSAAVRGLRRVGAADLREMEGRDMMLFEGAPVPVFRLADVLGLPPDPAGSGKMSVVVAGAGPDKAGFVVDQLLAEQEIVVKELGPRLTRVDMVTGAAILPSGQLALILTAADLLRTAQAQAPVTSLTAALAPAAAAARKRLLICDDSVTTRTLVKSILEAGGFDVLDAADGLDAWQLLQEHGADLVVSDVEMPRMDGFALTEAIRGSKRFKDLPVVLVTAREAEQDRLRGLDAGADAYLPKSAFDQTSLIKAIERLI